MRFLPVSVTGLVIVFYALLFWYGLNSDSTKSLPSWLTFFPLLILILAFVIGIFAALSVTGWSRSTVFYIVFNVIALCGVGSFYVFNEPTTINIFGLLTTIIGLLGAFVTGAVFIKTQKGGLTITRQA